MNCMFVSASSWVLSLLLVASVAAQSPSDRSSLYLSPSRQFSVPVTPWITIRGENVVMQQHEYSCGAASMATVLKYYYGDNVSETEILKAALGKLSAKELEDREANGLSMEDLSRGASVLGYPAAVLEVTYDKLRALPAPVIVRQVDAEFKHFVVFRGALDGRVFVADPLRGNVRLSQSKFLKAWDGKILAIAKQGMKPRQSHPLQIRTNWPVTPEEQSARRSLFPAPQVR
jgi:predicted double-glycine peptidase